MLLIVVTGCTIFIAVWGEAQTGDWSTSTAAAITQQFVSLREIRCIAIMFSGNFPPPEISLLTKKLQRRNAFQLLQCVPYHNPKWGGSWKGCSHLLQIQLAWLANEKLGFKSIINTSTNKVMESTLLTFLAKNSTITDLVGNINFPFTTRIIAAFPSKPPIKMDEAWRSAPGYPIRTASYATWSEDSGLVCKRSQCSYSYRNDLEGIPLSGATKEDMPLSELAMRSDGHLEIRGYFGDIFYEIASQLNMTAVVLQARENVTGSATEGQWNGLIGMLQRGEIDLAVGPISVHRSSLEVIDFVRPLLRTNYQVFFKQSGTVIEWDSFLKPFVKYVWFLILLWIIVAAFSLNFFYRIGVKRGKENYRHSWEYNKLNSFLTFLRTFSNQGTDRMPVTMSCRVLYLTGYLTSSILLTAYSAALISNLTTQEPLRPFDTLETFLSDGSYKLTAIGASTDYTYFSEATDETLKSIYKRQMIRDNLPTGKEEGLMAVCNGQKTALFITFAVTQISARKISASQSCPILYFKVPLGQLFMTIGIRKNMPYASMINQQVQTMAERGLLNRLQTKEWPPKPGVSNINRSQQVEIQQVAQIHAVLLTGITLSLFILLAEKLLNTSTADRSKILCHKHGITSDRITGFILVLIGTVLFGIVTEAFT